MKIDYYDVLLFIFLYAVGCIIIYVWQHRDTLFKDDYVVNSDTTVKGKISKTDILNDKMVATSNNFILVNSLFFTDNYFDFKKYLEFASNVEDEVSFSDAVQALSLLSLLVKVSSALNEDFYHQLFFSSREVISIKDIREKISNGVYLGTVADFYEITISLIFHFKKFLIYK